MKYEFASREWSAFLHGFITERLKALGEEASEIDYSVCEVFTDPPAHLSPNGEALAWHCVIRHGNLRFGTTAIDDTALHVKADYAALVPIGRYDTWGEPERVETLKSMVADAVADGRMVVRGGGGVRDPRLADIHDTMARVTL